MVLDRGAVARSLNPGPHGLTEISTPSPRPANNNGSAFGGLTGNTDWYNTTLGLAMLVGRFLLIIPVLAIAGRWPQAAACRRRPARSRPARRCSPALLVGVVVIVVGLTYFPVLALGPIVEHLAVWRDR